MGSGHDYFRTKNLIFDSSPPDTVVSLLGYTKVCYRFVGQCRPYRHRWHHEKPCVFTCLEVDHVTTPTFSIVGLVSFPNSPHYARSVGVWESGSLGMRLQSDRSTSVNFTVNSMGVLHTVIHVQNTGCWDDKCRLPKDAVWECTMFYQCLLEVAKVAVHYCTSGSAMLLWCWAYASSQRNANATSIHTCHTQPIELLCYLHSHHHIQHKCWDQ